MPPLVLFHTHRFLSSAKTCSPAAKSSVMLRQSMQTKAMAPSWQRAAAGVNVSTRKRLKEALSISPTHMANSRWRMRPEPNMAVNRNIVRRVSEYQVDVFVAEQRCIGVCVAGVTTNEPMAPQDPKVSRSAHSRSITLIRRDLVLGCRIGAVDRAIARFVDYDFGLG